MPRICLIYGTEAVVPVEVMVPSTLLALASKVSELHDRIHDVEALEKKRQSAENNG